MNLEKFKLKEIIDDIFRDDEFMGFVDRVFEENSFADIKEKYDFYEEKRKAGGFKNPNFSGHAPGYLRSMLNNLKQPKVKKESPAEKEQSKELKFFEDEKRKQEKSKDRDYETFEALAKNGWAFIPIANKKRLIDIFINRLFSDNIMLTIFNVTRTSFVGNSKDPEKSAYRLAIINFWIATMRTGFDDINQKLQETNIHVLKSKIIEQSQEQGQPFDDYAYFREELEKRLKGSIK
jgi:hypothetical protein